MSHEHPDPEITVCPCCLGDPDTVCAACGQHDCWAGNLMCHSPYIPGTCTRAEYAERTKPAEDPWD